VGRRLHLQKRGEGPIKLSDGSYNFYHFKGWAPIARKRPWPAYKAVNGIQSQVGK